MRPIAVTFLSLFASVAAAQETDREGDTVAFEVKSGVIFVEATVNGKGPFTFIFDTGASVTVLRPQTAKKLGIETKGGGLFSAPSMIKVESFALGKADVQDLPVAVMMVPQAEVPLAMQGIKYDGLVGYAYISQFVTTIDYRKKTIGLVPNDYTPEDPTTPAVTPKTPKSLHVGFSPRELGADEANEIGIDGGVVVQKVAKGSPADKGAMKEGDIIQEIDGKRIDTVEQYYAILRKSKPGNTLTFRVIRDKKDVDVKVTVQERK